MSTLANVFRTTQPDRASLADARRARETYRYLEPENLVPRHQRRKASNFDGQHDHVPSLSSALAPYCQLTALRCNCPKVLLNIMDEGTMYFLAEASRAPSKEDEDSIEFVEDPIFMTCSSVPLQGRVCEMTVRMDASNKSGVPMFTVSDLADSPFRNLEVVKGPPYWRFYAGTPLVSRDGVSIGSLAVMDKVPRQSLSEAQEIFLEKTAGQIMTYLETNRQAIDGRRSRRMALGLECFIAGQRSMEDHTPASSAKARASQRARSYGVFTDDSALNLSNTEQSTESEDQERPDSVDRDRSHSRTFARAANLLRESLEVDNEGSVIFIALKGGITSRTNPADSGQPLPVNDISEHHNRTIEATVTKPVISSESPAILAMSTPARPIMETQLPSTYDEKLPQTLLHSLVKKYPGGRIWPLDETARSSSDDDQRSGNPKQDDRLKSNQDKAYLAGPSNRKTKTHFRKIHFRKVIQAAFPLARQVLFNPVWDPITCSFNHVVFIATTEVHRSMNASTDLSFVNSFCSTLMGECSRLDTMRADKQKSDFVGTISHEMRSPLHGILASVEFLAETELTAFQHSLVDTIDSCGRTLLDTINHVLDYSKINSFQKHWQAFNERTAHTGKSANYFGAQSAPKTLAHHAPPLLQLVGITDISSVMEEVIDGIVLGNTFTSGVDITDVSKEARGRGRSSTTDPSSRANLDVILDVQPADWAFVTQPGAVRRIIMNIFGNAIKYSQDKTKGKVSVKLELGKNSNKGSLHELVVLIVKDTGKGISQQFLTSRLFTPFAQENSLAPGTGLGLSIVHSIVTMLGGTINIQSQLGEGTSVQVTLPMTRPLSGSRSVNITPQSGGTSISGSSAGEETICLLQSQASDCGITVYYPPDTQDDDLAAIFSNYIKEWYNMPLVPMERLEAAAVVIVDEDNIEPFLTQLKGVPEAHPAVVVLCSVAARHSEDISSSLVKRVSGVVELVTKPCGPYKLAKSIRAILERARSLLPQSQLSAPALDVITEQPTPFVSSAETSKISDDLQQMDLSGPSHKGIDQVVEASETLAASQTSQNAQMAIRSPTCAVPTPGMNNAIGEFPFPQQQTQPPERQVSISGITSPTTNGIITSDKQTQKPTATTQTKNFGPTKKESRCLVVPNMLLVDDNHINLRLLKTYMETKRKYNRFTLAENGLQAVEAFKSSPEPIDIIFMDISMPTMNGFEATRVIRDYEKSLGVQQGAMVIALTGLASGHHQSEGFDSGCDIYMTKPVSFKEVGKLLDNWEAHRRLRNIELENSV